MRKRLLMNSVVLAFVSDWELWNDGGVLVMASGDRIARLEE